MDIEGKTITCDRTGCGNSCFCQHIETTELDGGYTRVRKYANKPEGWGRIEKPVYSGIDRCIDLCPDCYYRYMELWDMFVNELVKEKV